MAKLNIQFDEEMDKMLEELAEKKGTTKAEIIRRALAIYKYVEEETRGGKRRLAITSAQDEKVLKEIISL